MESAMGEDLSNEDECPVWTASVRALSSAQGVPPNTGSASHFGPYDMALGCTAGLDSLHVADFRQW